jgi:hypothetical protein
MCQQSIEKLIKGLFVMFCDQEPPRTHNIAQVFKQIVEAMDGESKDTEEFIQKLDKYNAFFVKLLAYLLRKDILLTKKNYLNRWISKKLWMYWL